ncbi:MAG: MurR/RpiR family transcriptional regulator [Beduini sp.]
MKILTQFNDLERFSDAEQSLIEWILNNDEKLLTMSTKELANATYTSPATIVRLCQKLGLKGYNDFKIRYAKEIDINKKNNMQVSANYPFKKEDSFEKISVSLAQLFKEVIDETQELLNYEDLDKIADALIEADVIDVYSTSLPLICAMDFEKKLMHIGKRINVASMDGEQEFLVSNSTPRHCAIIISYSGQTEKQINLAMVAKKRKAKVISITSNISSPLAKISDFNICVSAREKNGTKIANFCSRTGINYVLDVLYSIIFVKEYDKNMIYKTTIEREIGA